MAEEKLTVAKLLRCIRGVEVLSIPEFEEICAMEDLHVTRGPLFIHIYSRPVAAPDTEHTNFLKIVHPERLNFFRDGVNVTEEYIGVRELMNFLKMLTELGGEE